MKTQKSVNKRERILEAAAKIIAEKGYAAATLGEIAEEVGTFAGSLYYYFPSKEALVEAVLNVGTTTVSEPVIAAVKALPVDASAYRRLKTALDVHVTHMLERNAFIVAYWKIVDQVPEEVSIRHRKHPRAYGNFWRELVREGQRAGLVRADVDANLAQLFLLGSTIYALDWFDPAGRMTAQDISDALADIAFGGLFVAGAAEDLVMAPAKRSA